MAERTLAQKTGLKPNMTLAIINAPDHYERALAPLPDGVTVARQMDTPCDAVHLFVYNKADIDTHAPRAIAAVKPGGLLWIAYPKKSGAIKTDISRDHGWDALAAADWHGVTQISLDDTWSMLRFRPRAEIRSFTRKF